MKDKQLLNEINEVQYENDVKLYLKDLINLSISPFHDIDTLNKIKINKLEYEIIKFNLISKAVNAIENIDNIKVSNKNNFTIKLNELNILRIQFLNNIDISVYNRSKLESIYNSLKLEMLELENKLNYYSVSDNYDKIKYINYRLKQLEELLKCKHVTEYEKKINDSLEIPTSKGRLVGQDDLYKTEEIFSNRKILIYKDSLYK